MSGFLDGFGDAPPQADDGAGVPSAWPSLTEPTRLVPVWMPAQPVRAPAAAPQPQTRAPVTTAKVPAAYPTEGPSPDFAPPQEDYIERDLSARDELERRARAFGVDFAPATPDGQLRAMVHESEAAQTPPSEAAGLRDRIEAELDAFARERGLPWQEKQSGPASPPRNSPTPGAAEDTSGGDVEDARAGLVRRAAELGIDVDANTSDAQLRAEIFEALEARTRPEEAGAQSARLQAELDRAIAPLGMSLKEQTDNAQGVTARIDRRAEPVAGPAGPDGEAAMPASLDGASFTRFLDPVRARLPYAPSPPPMTETPPVGALPRLPPGALGALMLPLLLRGDTPMPRDSFPVTGRDDLGTRVDGRKIVIYKAPSSWFARIFDDGKPLTALDLDDAWQDGRRTGRILDADGNKIGTLANDKVELSPEALAALDARDKEATQTAAAPAEPQRRPDDDKPRICPDPTPRNEAMSADARAYQQQITGLPPNLHMILNGVDFDGCDENTGYMLDAKARYSQFLDETGGKWMKWFDESLDKGWPAMRAKARQQNKAVAGTGRRVEYHCAEEPVHDLLKKLFADDGLGSVDIRCYVFLADRLSVTGATE